MKTFVKDAQIGSLADFFIAYSVSGVLPRMFLAPLPDRIGPKRVLFPAMAMLACGFGVLAIASSDAHVVGAGIFCGLGHGFTFPILMGMVVSRAPDADRGTAMAIFTALFDVGMLMGGPGFGAAIRVWGYPVAFALAAGLLVAGGIVFALWDRERIHPAGLRGSAEGEADG